MADTNPPPTEPAQTTTAATTSSPPPAAPTSTEHQQPQPDLVPDEDRDENDDADSSLGDDAASSTASVSASILEYRTIQGRTYHADRHPTEYFTPNDEQQLQSVDITHHYLQILINYKLFLAPIKDDVKKVLDVGTGSGIWAMDFADLYPGAEVIGSDLSPCQPEWVPPNVQFEIDDATNPWTWKEDTFDFIHIRYLFGAIKDWNALFRESYKCCAPGGWVESVEADVHYYSDDGTDALEPVLKTWGQLYEDGGKITERPFFPSLEGLQEKGMEAAGFTDIKVVDYKLPVGNWPKDPKLAEVGSYVKLTLENDIEGYTLLLWNNLLQWPKDDYQMFLMGMRKALKNRKLHSYMKVRFVYGRKPTTV